MQGAQRLPRVIEASVGENPGLTGLRITAAEAGKYGIAALGTVILGLGISASAALAQTTELPPVVVTAPSPVAKPKPASRSANKSAAGPKAKRKAKAPTAPADDEFETASPAPNVDMQSLPGTVIVAEDSFVPVTIVTERQIEATHGATLTDTLATKPGIVGSTFAPGANRPIIRGLDNTRVRIQENGIGAHDVSSVSEDHAFPFDPFSADRVEVVRGPATLRYGSQAIGGVVSIENERIPTYMPRGGFSTEIRGALSSVDDGSEGGFKTTAGINGIVVHADAYKRRADDYETPHGTQENSFVDSETFSVGTSYVWNDGFIGVAFSRFDSLYGIPGGEAAERGVRIDMNQDRFTSRGEWRPKSNGIEAIRYWFGISDYRHDEIGASEDDPSVTEIGSTFLNDEREARVEVQHQPLPTAFGALNGAVGIQWNDRDMSAAGEGGELLAPNSTTSIAGFMFEELAVTDRLRLQAAARIEQTDIDGTAGIFPDDFEFTDGDLEISEEARRRTFTPLSASLGLLYDLPFGFVGRLNGQYVERAPDAAELFSKGVHEATGTFEIGDPDLDIEKASTVELGFSKARGPFKFDGSAYYTKFDGFIYKRLTGNTCSEDEGCHPEDVITTEDRELKQVVFTQRDAAFYGLELGAQYDVGPLWRGVWGIDGQYDFVRATFSGGENVPRIPPHRLGGGIYYRDNALFARTGLLHAFDQDKVGVGETETDGYDLLTAEISYTMQLERTGSVIPEMTIGLKGENLLNDDVRNAVSFKKDEVLLPGANVKLFGTIKFN